MELIERFRQRRRSARVSANKTCNLCGALATKVKRDAPWPGTSYAHTTYTCDEHGSYLHGHSWASGPDGVWIDQGVPKSSCICGGVYGACGCERMAVARQFRAWERRSVFGDV